MLSAAGSLAGRQLALLPVLACPWEVSPMLVGGLLSSSLLELLEQTYPQVLWLLAESR